MFLAQDRAKKRKTEKLWKIRFQSWGLSCFPLDFPCMRASVVSNSKYRGSKFREICPKLDRVAKIKYRHNGSVWIELIFAETENWNWKHYSKIIFKCMNSAVEPIFNEKVVEKWNLWIREQCTSVLFTVEKSTNAATVHKQCMNSSRITPWNAWKPKK